MRVEIRPVSVFRGRGEAGSKLGLRRPRPWGKAAHRDQAIISTPRPDRVLYRLW